MSQANSKDITNRANELRRERRAIQRRIDVDRTLGKEPAKNDLIRISHLDVVIEELDRLLT